MLSDTVDLPMLPEMPVSVLMTFLLAVAVIATLTYLLAVWLYRTDCRPRSDFVNWPGPFRLYRAIRDEPYWRNQTATTRKPPVGSSP